MIRLAVIVALTVWLVLALAMTRVEAEPQVGDMFGPSPMAGGMICDTQAEVYGYIDAVAANDPAMHPPGCGRLVQPMMMAWQIVELYEAHGFQFVLVRFLIFTGDAAVEQFGVWDIPQKIEESI